MRVNRARKLTMNRTAIYARFSTDLQNERSIDDQLALCRAYAEREGLNVVATFDDRARSGGSVLGRDGLLHLMDKAREHQFDVLVVEALDRLSRDMEDLAGIHKRLSFLGIEIRAVHEGVVNTVLVGLRGLVGQLYREDIAHKVRRGQAGRVNKGLHAGGLTYGYSYMLGDPGKRLIAEGEAEIVRRIFREYVGGQTPRDIAHKLNRDRIPPPRGRGWNASTINGNVQRGTGLLHNELYAGRLIWNRVRMIKDPDTGKRVSRPNPKGEWRVVAVPDLAIVSSDLFDAAQARKKARATTHPSHQRRPRHMLTGLLRCGTCGAGMSSKGTDKSKRIRIRCSAATESGICADPKTFYLDTVETAVLNGLTAELRHPEVIAQYVQTYHEERKRLAADTDARRTHLERRLEELTREIERLVNAIAKGHGDPAVLGPQSTTLNEERKCILAELDRVPPATGVIALHPAVLARYEEQLNQLQTGLAKGIASGDSECAEAMRDLVDTVTVFRDPSKTGGVEIEIAGRLTALLGERAFPHGIKGVGGMVVAGEGLEPPTPGL
ncbi:recombinase family protein [Mesorhizobium loti]|uniref:recombinase family protein n=1 Tax=Rhizobium loti TaxID=381 RepID=UPI0031BAC322